MTAIAEVTGLEQFVHERGRSLWRAAWLLTGDAHHADDLVQTALAKTWGRYPQMENDQQFEAYVCTTIYRTFCSWWRRRSWRSEAPTESLPESGAQEVESDLRLELRRALDELPRMQRIVDDVREYSEAKVADYQMDASITLTNQWGDVLRLGKLDGRPGFS